MKPDQKKKYFLPCQIKWINDRSPLRIMEKSRQVGLTCFDARKRAADESFGFIKTIFACLEALVKAGLGPRGGAREAQTRRDG